YVSVMKAGHEGPAAHVDYPGARPSEVVQFGCGAYRQDLAPLHRHGAYTRPRLVHGDHGTVEQRIGMSACSRHQLTSSPSPIWAAQATVPNATVALLTLELGSPLLFESQDPLSDVSGGSGARLRLCFQCQLRA